MSVLLIGVDLLNVTLLTRVLVDVQQNRARDYADKEAVMAMSKLSVWHCFI